MEKMFQKFADGVSRMLGSFWTLFVVTAALLGTGFIFQFSEGWKTVVDFTITIGTFLILFFLQKSQNVGNKATHAKLDELIRAVHGARNEFAAAEDKEEREIDRLKERVAEECDSDDDRQNDMDPKEDGQNLNQQDDDVRR